MPGVEVKDRRFDYGAFNRKTKLKNGTKLFPTKGKPDIIDVKQGYTDLDCYFLAAIIAVLKQNPEKIMNCFPDYKGLSEEEVYAKFNSDPTIRIRFFKVKIVGNMYVPNGTVDIIVDKTVLRKKGAAWVRFLEKAYSIYKAKKCDGYGEEIPDKEFADKKIKSRIIDGIYGGDSGSVIVTLTGKKSHTEYLGTNRERSKFKKFDKYSEEAIALYDRIERYLRKGKAVTASANRGSTLYKRGLFFQHVYAVIGTEEKAGYKYVTVQNPYANRSREYSTDSKGNHHSITVIPKEKDKRGRSNVELNDFCRNFEDIEVEDD